MTDQTTISGVIIALAPTASVFATYALSRRERKAQNVNIDRVHEAVNSTAAKQNERVDQLTATLTTADVDVPPRGPNGATEPS